MSGIVNRPVPSRLAGIMCVCRNSVKSSTSWSKRSSSASKRPQKACSEKHVLAEFLCCNDGQYRRKLSCRKSAHMRDRPAMQGKYRVLWKRVSGLFASGGGLSGVYKCRSNTELLSFARMDDAYVVPYRVESLQTNLRITPACPAVVARWALAPPTDEPDCFNVDKLNLVSITKKDCGECLFACIAMAVYGTENKDNLVRNMVCDFIEHKIIPNYHTLSTEHKVTLMLHFSWITHHDHDKGIDKPYDLPTFNAEAAKYINRMRNEKTCGHDLELSVACYIFRMEIMIIQKYTISRNRKTKTTYSRLDFRKGHDLTIVGMEDDGVGSLMRATPNKAAKIQSVVMVFSIYEVIPNDDAEAGPALSSVQKQALLLAKECARVGHYQLMAMKSDDAGEGPSGSGKKSHNGAAGAVDEEFEDTSDEDYDSVVDHDAQARIQKFKEQIQEMRNKEYDFVHNFHKKQKRLDDTYNSHTDAMAKRVGNSEPHIVEQNQKLQKDAELHKKKHEKLTNDRMHAISLAQAQLKEVVRTSRDIDDPNDQIFDKDIEKYMAKAQERYAKNIQKHKNYAAAPKSAAALQSPANYDIPQEKERMRFEEITRQNKTTKSNNRVGQYRTELAKLNAVSVKTSQDSKKIQKLEEHIQKEANFIIQLETHKAYGETRLAFLEASNNGLKRQWIEANPAKYIKITKKPTANP